MKLFTLALLLSCGLWAQEGYPKVVVKQDSDLNTNVCWIDYKDRVTVTPGREKMCWEEVAQAHNRGMNDSEYHKKLDKFLNAFEVYFGKRITKCAR
jgi:hypothetical protein